MAGVNYQYELIKMYLAAFIRPPEKSGLEYWLFQLNTGKSFDSVLETVFSLDIVKDIYPTNLPYESFITLIYVNVFGKSPDLQGLNYWKQQMIDGRSRGNLVMDMINAGLSTPDGTAGKAYIVNRMSVAQFAVDQQFAQKADLSPVYLKTVMLSVNSNPDTITSANKLLGSGATGIGLSAPINALSVVAAADGISAAEAAAGVTVLVDLLGTNAAATNTIELLIDGRSFPTAIKKQLSAADITAKKVSLLIPNTMNWGADGIKLLQVTLKNNLGSSSPPGGDLRVDLNIVAPKAPDYSLFVPASEDSINLIEKAAGVSVQVFIADTGAVVGDKLEILLNGQSFNPKVTVTLTADDIDIGIAGAIVPGTANWGVDGEKMLAARIVDKAGNIGGSGGEISVILDTIAPNPPTNAVKIPAAAGGLSNAETALPVSVIVDLTGTGAKAGDGVELLIDNAVFGASTLHVLTAEDIAANSVTLSIAPLDTAWSIADGSRSISVRMSDSAGNLSKGGGNLSVTVDSNAPKSETTTFTIDAAKDGISGIEKAAGVAVVVNLVGSGAAAGDTVNILIGTQSPQVLFSQVLTAAQISAKQAIVTIPSSVNWGSDGNKSISVSFTDLSGNVSSASPSMTVVLDTTAPQASIYDLQVPISLNGINTAEKFAGVVVNVNLTGTQAVVKDKLEILVNGVSFTTPVLRVLTADDIANNIVSITIPGNALWGTDGIKQISARVIDVAGNIGELSSEFEVLIDTTPPSGLTTPLIVPANIDGGISITEKNAGVEVKLNLAGSNVQIGDRVELLIGGASFANPITYIVTQADLIAQSLSMFIAPNDGWGSDGAKTLSVRFIDFAGNLGQPSGTTTVILDSIPPNPTGAMITVAAAQNGINLVEKMGIIDVVVDLNGTGAMSGDTINLYLDGVPFSTPVKQVITAAQALAKLATIKVPANSDWGSDGSHVLTVIITDAAGNPGVSGGTLIIDVDTTAPTAATVPVDIPVANNGVSNAEKNAGVAVDVNLTGTGATVGDKVEVLLNGVGFATPILSTLSAGDIASNLISVNIPSSANWGIDGVKSISFKVIDVAGNIGAIGGTLSFTLDTQAPAGPTRVLVVPANSAGGISQAELNVGVDVVVNLTGTTCVAGDIVEILIGGGAFTTPVTHVMTAAEILAKSATLTIQATDGWGSDGLKALTARFIDSVGNIGTAAGLVNVTLDALPPNPVATPLVVAAATNGISNTERLAGVSVVVNLTGTTAVAGDKISILIDGVPFATPVIHTITAAQALAKSATVLIPGTAVWGVDGDKILSATITDATANVSLSGGDVTVLLDTTPPLAPSNALSIAAALSGINANEKTAGVAVVVDLAGSAAVVGDRLELVIGGVAFSTPVNRILTAADISNGVVTLTIASGSGWGTDGTKSIAARLVDAAGNIGASGPVTSLVLDTVAPAGPTATLSVPANSGGGITTVEKNAGVDVIVNLTGTSVVAGDMVEILIGGISFANPVNHILTAAEILARSVTITVGGNDGWGTDGAKILTARFTDIAGNSGTNTGTLTVTIDSGAPNPPLTPMVVAAATNGINSTEKLAGVSVVVNLAGTGAVAGDTIHLLIDGLDFPTPVTHVLTSAQITANTVTIAISGTAVWGADGSKVLTATITDGLGNTGVPGGDVTVVLDTTGPTVPSNPLVVTAAANGLSLAEKTAGVSVSVDLTGTSLVTGDSIELLLNHFSFATPVTKILTALEVGNGLATITIPGTANWGVDGNKIVSMRGVDVAGNNGVEGGDLTVTLDTIGPSAPLNAVSVPANAGGGITAAEKNAGVLVTVDLTGAGLQAGEQVEILIGGAALATPVLHTLTGADITANSVSLTIGASDGWGADGSKVISARYIDISGNAGTSGGSTSVLMLDTTPPNVPNLPMSVPVNASGINLSEKNTGVTVVVNLAGTNAAAGDIATLLIDGLGFAVPVTHTITAGEVTAGSFNFVVGSNDGWGVDGSKLLSMSMTDVAGNIGATGGDVTVQLDATLPNAPSNAVSVPAAANGINLTEKTLGVAVVVDLAGTNAVAGDKVEILLGGASFSAPVFYVLSGADILSASATVTIAGAAGWGADGVKNLSARIEDSSGNIGLAGGSLLTNLETVMPAAAALPSYTDVDGSSTINAGDTFVFIISEATNKLITTNEVLLNNAHTLGTGATAVWSPDGTQLTVTLGASATLALGDIVTLVGVSDLAGNSLDLAFSI